MEANKSTAITTVKHELRLSEWSAQIESQQSSGLSVQKWCAENGINPKTYYYRLRKVREQCIESAPSIVPLSVPQSGDKINIEKNINTGSSIAEARAYHSSSVICFLFFQPL